MLSMSARALSAKAAFLMLLATPALAQDQQVMVFSSGDRPRIGVMLEGQANPEHDKYGAYIQEVTPDGPAAKAGIKSGDIVTSFNGVSLAGLKAEDDESGPAKRLRELAGKLEPGDTVKVEYRRGTETKKTTLVAEELQQMTVRRMRGPDGAPPMWSEGPDRDFTVYAPRGRMHTAPFPGGERGFRFFSDGPEGPDGPGLMRWISEGPTGLQLATVNAGLGEYFNAKSGALVLDVPSDSTIQLKPGDVIVAIDGRAVTSEEQARRILRSYADSETAKIEVMRQKKKTSVSWKAPDASQFKRRLRIHVREDAPESMKVEVEKD
jgi:C-terminal processing protease CtpA/Prc